MAVLSDGSLASAMPKGAARHGEVQGAAGRNEERVVRSGVFLLTTSATGTWQEPGDVGLEGERTGSVRVSPNVTGDGAKGHAWRCCSPCGPVHAAESSAKASSATSDREGMNRALPRRVDSNGGGTGDADESAHDDVGEDAVAAHASETRRA